MAAKPEGVSEDDLKKKLQSAAKKAIRTNTDVLSEVIAGGDFHNIVVACEKKELITQYVSSNLLDTSTTTTKRQKATDLVHEISTLVGLQPRHLDTFLCVLVDKGGLKGREMAFCIAKEYGHKLQIFEANMIANIPACQILNRFSEKLSKVSLPPDAVRLMYTERLINQQVLHEEDEQSEDDGVVNSLLRALYYTAAEDHEKIKHLASVLSKSEDAVLLGNNIMENYNQVFLSHQPLHDNTTLTVFQDLSTSNSVSDIVPSNSCTTSSQTLEVRLSLDPVETIKFKKVEQNLALLLHRLSPLIEAAIPSLNDLKELLLRCPNIEPQLIHAQSFDRVFKIAENQCTVIDISLMETIVECYSISVAQNYISDYLVKLDEFCEINICNVQLQRFPHALLTCETVKFIVDWETSHCSFRTIKGLLYKAFRDFVKNVKVMEAKVVNSIAIICFAPRHLMDVLLMEAERNIDTLKELGLIQLTIGYYTVYDKYRSEKEFSYLTVTLKDTEEKLKIVEYELTSSKEEIQTLSALLQYEEDDLTFSTPSLSDAPSKPQLKNMTVELNKKMMMELEKLKSELKSKQETEANSEILLLQDKISTVSALLLEEKQISSEAKQTIEVLSEENKHVLAYIEELQTKLKITEIEKEKIPKTPEGELARYVLERHHSSLSQSMTSSSVILDICQMLYSKRCVDETILDDVESANASLEDKKRALMAAIYSRVSTDHRKLHEIATVLDQFKETKSVANNIISNFSLDQEHHLRKAAVDAIRHNFTNLTDAVSKGDMFQSIVLDCNKEQLITPHVRDTLTDGLTGRPSVARCADLISGIETAVKFRSSDLDVFLCVLYEKGGGLGRQTAGLVANNYGYKLPQYNSMSEAALGRAIISDDNVEEMVPQYDQMSNEDRASDILRTHYSTLSQSLKDPVNIARLLHGENVISEDAVTQVDSAAIKDRNSVLLSLVRRSVHDNHRHLYVFGRVLQQLTAGNGRVGQDILNDYNEAFPTENVYVFSKSQDEYTSIVQLSTRANTAGGTSVNVTVDPEMINEFVKIKGMFGLTFHKVKTTLIKCNVPLDDIKSFCKFAYPKFSLEINDCQTMEDVLTFVAKKCTLVDISMLEQLLEVCEHANEAKQYIQDYQQAIDDFSQKMRARFPLNQSPLPDGTPHPLRGETITFVMRWDSKIVSLGDIENLQTYAFGSLFENVKVIKMKPTK